MKYDKVITDQITVEYQSGMSALQIAEKLSTQVGESIPERSIIAKLSSLGVYKKKEYLTKRGGVPTKKEEYIDRIALLLGVPPDTLESLEKVNKNVLALLDSALRPTEAPIIN